METWFTSDWHLGHENALKWRKTDEVFPSQIKSIIDMNQFILNSTLELTKPGDKLYWLGDIFWKQNIYEIQNVLDAFKKKRVNIFWVKGNHDPEFKHSVIAWKGLTKSIVVEKQKIFMSHFPHLVWDSSHYGSWHLFGHLHKNDNTSNQYNKLVEEGRLPQGKTLNVNLEFHNYKPVNFEDVKKIIVNYRPDNFDFIKKEGKNGKADNDERSSR